MHHGHVFVFVGPSGSGKTSLIQVLQGRGLGSFLPTTTTRPPREGERHGIDYNFVTPQEFEELLRGSEFLEWQEIHGFWYGSPRRLIEDTLRAGRTGLMSLDVLGGYRLRTAFPSDVTLVFVALPSIDVLRERLLARGTEDGDSLARRLSRAKMEMDMACGCDAFVMNDDLDRAARACENIIAITYENKRVMGILGIMPAVRRVELNGKATVLGPFETAEQGRARLQRDPTL